MSQSQAATLPDPQTAYNNLFQGVHQRVFFQKMASYGISPKNRKQADSLLKLAGVLRAIEEEAMAKEAGDANDPFAAEIARIQEACRSNGIGKVAAFQEEELAIKQAASNFMADPTFYNSVLSLKAAEVAQLSENLAAA